MVLFSVILGFAVTLSAFIGLMNNGLIFFYLKKKLPIHQTAFDLVVSDSLILISLNTLLIYIIYMIGLTTTSFPYAPSAILAGLNQIFYIGFNVCALVILIVKYVYLEHGYLIYDTSDSTIRKLAWLIHALLTTIYMLINNYGPRSTSPFLFKFLVKDETIESPIKTGIGVPISALTFFAFGIYLQYLIEPGYHPNEDKTSYRHVLALAMLIAIIYWVAKIFLDIYSFVHILIVVGLTVRGQIVPLLLFRNNENLKNFMRNCFKSVPIIPK